MSDFFTTFKAITPPPIITKDDQNNYNQILQLTQHDIKLPDISDYLDNQNDLNFTYQTYSEKPQFKTSSNNSDNQTIHNIIGLARSFVGGKYKWGGSSPSTGFDCSGLIQYVFKQNGINLPRSSVAQGKLGKSVDLNNARPGDLIWFGSKQSPSGSHIGLISKIDNGQVYIIDAAGKNKGILERPLPNLQIKSIKRLFGDIQLSSSGISSGMSDQIKIMESGSINPKSLTAKTNSHFGENFATGAFGMTRQFDRPGNPKIKSGETYSLERWNNIFNAFYSKEVNKWKEALKGKSNVTQDKLDALASISASGNWAQPNGEFGKFVIANWDNPRAIYNKWLKTGITARGNGKVQKGLIKRRYLEANWFMGNKINFKQL